MPRTLVNNGIVVTMDRARAVHVTGHVVVEDRLITAIGPGPATPVGDDVVIDASDCAVLPGFVNTHHHLAATLLRGMAPDAPLTVRPKTDSLTMRLHRAQGEEECYAGALLAAVELTRSGVTTTTDSQAPWKGIGKNDGSLRAAVESGMRVVHSPAFVDRTEMVPGEHQFGPTEAVREFERLRAAWSNGRVTVIPEVLSLPRGTDALISALGRAGDGRLAMHLSYSREFAHWAQREYGHTAIEHLDGLGVLGEGFLGAHPVYLCDEEVEIYARSGSAGSYCAVSNMLIGVDHLPLIRLRAAGIRMGLGLDSPNHGHNFFETMKVSLLAQKQLAADASVGSAADALAWATIDGAAALGLDAQIGSLEPGKCADLQVIDLRRAHLWPPAGALSLLVYSGSPASVRDVMADGRWLLRGGHLTLLDEPAIMEHAALMQARVAEAAGLTAAPLMPAGW